jgi:hypothetical protein
VSNRASVFSSGLFVLAACAALGAGQARAQTTTGSSGLRGSTTGGAGTTALSPLSPGLSDPAATSSFGAQPPAPDDGKPARPGARPTKRAKPNPTQALKKGKATLPALVPYRTAPGASARGGAMARGRQTQPGPTVAVTPYPAAPRRAKVEENPYAQVGIGVGAMRLRPFVEGMGGYDDNPLRAAKNAKGTRVGRIDAGVAADADWGRHQFRASLRGGYARYFDAPSSDRPDGDAAATLNLEAARDTRIQLDAKARLDSQRANSPEVTSLGTRGATISGRPLIWSSGVGAAVTHDMGRLSATLRGTIDRTDYQDATLSDGAKLKLSNESYTDYGASLRLGYEASPGFKPFVEASVDRRVRDNALDASGYKRDSTGVTGRAGAAFELTRTLTGEASAGYGQRHYEDARLADLRGPVFDASLVWAATPLTTVTLKGSTSFNETTVTGASGSIARRASVEISHALLRNLSLTGALSVGETDYQGATLKEKSLAATVKADYNLTRSVVVRGSFTHERLTSTTANSDYTANVFLLGLRLQR